MNPDDLRRTFGIVVSLWVAAVLQSGASAHMAIFGARPDFLLLLGLVWPLVLRPSSGCIVGFFSGVLHGWVTGVSLTVNAIARCIAGYVSGMAPRSGFDVDSRSAAVVAFTGTLVIQAAVFFAAPPSDRLGFLKATIGMALYNGVLAFPVFWVVRRLSGPRDDLIL
jgi:rod shape-determining protein MreD